MTTFELSFTGVTLILTLFPETSTVEDAKADPLVEDIPYSVRYTLSEVSRVTSISETSV